MIDLGVKFDLVEKSGAWFSYNNIRIGQGRENARTYLEQHPETLEKIESMVLAKHGIRRNAKASDAIAAVPAAPAKKGAESAAAAKPAKAN